MTDKLILAGLVILISLLIQPSTRSQGTTPTAGPIVEWTNSGTVASCPAPIPGWSARCQVATGTYLSNNGGAWFLVQPQAASTGVQKVNGVPPGATGNVQITCSQPPPGSITLSTLSSQGVPISCAGIGN